MSSEKLCEKCIYAKNPTEQGSDHAKWVVVECSAPVPAYADMIGDDNTTGHKAAERCPCYTTK